MLHLCCWQRIIFVFILSIQNKARQINVFRACHFLFYFLLEILLVLWSRISRLSALVSFLQYIGSIVPALGVALLFAGPKFQAFAQSWNWLWIHFVTRDYILKRRVSNALFLSGLICAVFPSDVGNGMVDYVVYTSPFKRQL